MKKYNLTNDEFAAIAIFLHAQSIPGLAFDLTELDDQRLLAAQEQLRANGHMVAGDRQGTWHLDEDLMLLVLTVVQPSHLILIQDLTGKRSMQFSLDQGNISAVVSLKAAVVIAEIESIDDVAKRSIEFLSGAPRGRVSVAAVKEGKLFQGTRYEITETEIEHPAGKDVLSAKTLKMIIAERLRAIGFKPTAQNEAPP